MPTQTQLTEVARIYSRAAAAGKRPAKAVSDAMELPQPTANNWIRRAKDRGLLPEHVAVRNQKAERVAKALGVGYDILIAAIIKHAGGDLRVQP